MTHDCLFCRIVAGEIAAATLALHPLGGSHDS